MPVIERSAVATPEAPPLGWQVKQLSEIGHFKNGINKNGADFGHGYRFVNLLDVFGTPVINAKEPELGLLNTNSEERALYDLKKGDVLFVRSSVKPTGVGLTSLVEENLRDTVFSGFLIRFRPLQDYLVDSYKRYCFADSRFRTELLASSSVSANTNINQVSLRKLKILLPPKPEQRVIAEALRDTDELIESLGRLIAKQSDIKDSTMHQLLSAKIRLPGFAGEWKPRQLGEVADIVSGGTPKTSEPAYWNGGIQWCTPTDITGTAGKYLYQTERTITELGMRTSSARLLPPGTLLLCSRATIGDVKIAAGPVTTNQGFKCLICKNCVDNEFLYYKVQTIKRVLLEKAFGSTFLEISKTNLASIEIQLPGKAEQLAIARVLSDIDSELEHTAKLLTKTREIKSGMMQQLLTGKVRLA